MTLPTTQPPAHPQAARMLAVGLLILTSITAGCAPRPGTAAPPPGAAAGGALLIVGGGTQPRALVQRFVDLAGGAGRARIAVFPQASEAATTGGPEKAAQLQAFGAEAFAMNVTRAEALDAATSARLDGVTGIWFSGGDQSRLTAVLAGTPLLEAIRARYRAGAVVAGTSAGAAVMSDSMLTGNQRRPGVDTVGYFGDTYPHVARATIELVPGFGFLPGALVDQHFIRRERHNRLLAAILERPGMIGVGIDEGTALEVRGGRWRVIGASAVVIYDARAAHITTPGAPILGATGVAFHLIPDGGEFDPATGRARLP